MAWQIIVKKHLPKTGEFSDVCGVFSERISINTENARRIETPNDSCSPESVGTMNVNVERIANTIVGMMMFRT